MKREDWNRRYAEREFVWTLEPNRYVAAELADLAPGRALDLASGEGRNALWLAERGWRVIAVDFSDVGMDKARQRAARLGLDIEWVVADVLEYAPPAGGFDLVLLSYLQLPQDERRQVLATARRALAPGGTLLWVAHDLSNLARGHGGPKSAEVLSTPEDVVADLAGLEIVEAKVVERPVEEEGAVVGIARDSLVRAVAKSQ